MLGYENQKEDAGYQTMPPYHFMPQQMGMPPQHWGMMLGGPRPMPPNPNHIHGHSVGPGPPMPPHFMPPMMQPQGELSPSGVDDLGIPSPVGSDTSSTGSSNYRGRRGKQNYAAPVSPPPTRERFSYTRYQLELLNGIYTKIRYPNSMQKQLVAKRVGITRDQTKIWFQNRRRKDITCGKGSEADDSSPKMVPADVLTSILNELLSYENEPKGKKAITAQKSYEKKVAVKRNRQASESSTDEIPPSEAKRQRTAIDTYVPVSTIALPHEQNQISHLKSDSLPVVHFANAPSPAGNSVGYDSFSSNSHSPFSSASHHESEASSISSANMSSRNQSHNDSSSNSAVELGIQNTFRTVSSQELDQPAPPNAVVPGLDPNLLERPRSLESPANTPYMPSGTTDDGLLLSTSAAKILPGLSSVTYMNSAPLHLDPSNIILSSGHNIHLNIPERQLTVAGENELHITTLPNDGILVANLPKESSPKTKQTESNNLEKEIPPNVVAPPSKPLNFDTKLISLQAIKPTPVPTSVAQAEAKARELEKLRNINNNNTMTTSSSAPDMYNVPPLYSYNTEIPSEFNWLRPPKDNFLYEAPMYLPTTYPYPGQPGMFGENFPGPTSPGFEKMMPYMMGCMPGFPPPPDPNFIGKNNNTGIFKDVYPPAFFMPPYGIPAPGAYPAYEAPADMSTAKKTTV